MKICNFITVFFLITVIGIQSIYGQEKINQFDLNGKRTGVWKKYYSNKRLRYQGQFEAGKEVGVFKYYSAASSNYPIAIKSFQKNTNMASVKFYSEKGILESEGDFNGKKRIGTWVYYHNDGKSVLSRENYENGILNGESVTYYISGKITETSHFKNGKLHGNLKRYADTGVLLDDLNYENGKLHGNAKYFNIEGKLIYWGAYENDEKVGKWEYFENGKPVNYKTRKQD